MAFDLVVSGGTVVAANAIRVSDIGVSDGKIAAIEPHLTTAGAREVPAHGMMVVPGAIDVHTHFANRIGGLSTADDYESGTRAAALGGITTIINVAFQEHGATLHETAEAELAKAIGKSHLDFGVHLTITDAERSSVLDEIHPLVLEGFSSFKVFTAVPGLQLTDAQLLRVLERAASERVLVNVHAEDEALIAHLTKRLLTSGRTQVRFLPEGRPPAAEAIATARTAQYAASVGCAIYFVHLSSRLALEAVRRARSDGAEAYVETRPVYLFLDRSRYELPPPAGNNYVCWPPLRERSDQEALWSGLASGEIQTYATDHTTYMASQKADPSLSFADVPGGVANVQTSIGLLFGLGVSTGRLTIDRFVEVTASNPAKLFGLWPSKGSLVVGGDADIVVIDPNEVYRITQAQMASRSDFDPFDGVEIRGWPTVVIARGVVVAEGGEVVSQAGQGRFLRRSRFMRW